MQHNKVLILDFGSQYTQLIARRVRELNIYCEIHPFNKVPQNSDTFKAVILSGSPFSVRGDEALHPDLTEIRGKKPLLAVCYGAQYLAHFSGGNVAPSNTREYGRANLSFIKGNEPFLAHGPFSPFLPSASASAYYAEPAMHLHCILQPHRPGSKPSPPRPPD